MRKRFSALSKSKWITSSIIFFIIIGISKDISINKDQFITFYELVLEELNENHSLIFAMSFIILLFSATCEMQINQLSSRLALVYLRQAITTALLLIFIFLTASLVYSLISRGFDEVFVNEWSYNNAYAMTGKSPVVCLAISVLLFGLRCVFLFYLITLINILTQKPYWGIWSVLFICFIDFRFYNQTHIPYPLNILPVEHTRILYTSAFNSPAETVTRGSYLISVLYWIILILIIYEIIEYINKKRGLQH